MAQEITIVSEINDVPLKKYKLFSFKDLMNWTELYNMLIVDQEISATDIDFNPLDYGYEKLTTPHNKEYYIQAM